MLSCTTNLNADRLEGKEVVIDGLEQGDALRQVTRDVFDGGSFHVLEEGI